MSEGVGPDWDAVRRDYEEGLGSQVEIAARHGVHPVTLAMQKIRKGWVGVKDIERWAKRDEAIDDLIDKVMARLKKQAKESAALEAAARKLAAAPCGAAELEARCEVSARAGRDLAAMVTMTATVQRMAERRRQDNVRFAVPMKENPLERAEYLAVERAILARIAAGDSGGGVGAAE